MNEGDLLDWVTNVLNVPSNTFSGLPACPYAMNAVIDNSVKILQPPIDMIEVTIQLNYGKEVVIYWFEPDEISPCELETKCKSINRCYPELIALDDHPSAIEKVENVLLNQGTWALILIQKRQKLETARKKLSKLGYYKNWTPEYLDEVLGV